jgi:hypothetical protein
MLPGRQKPSTGIREMHRHTLDLDDIRQSFYSTDTSSCPHTVKLSANTIGKHIQIIKLIMNEAFEAGITSNLSHKNRHFITLKEPAEGIYLNKEELKAIEELDADHPYRPEKFRHQ